MKRLLTLALVCVLVLACLASCGSPKGDDPDVTTEKTGKDDSKTLTVYEDFTLYGDDLLKGAGYDGYSSFEGGNLADVTNVEVKSVRGKENVLSFITTPFYGSNGDKAGYSGGGVYIDLSPYLPDGKIDTVQDFTITITTYQDTSVGHRIGVIWGDGKKDLSYRNVWKNNFSNYKPEWKTLTVTSNELRSLEGCSNKEITGIYIGINSSAYTCAIESVRVTFDKMF